MVATGINRQLSWVRDPRRVGSTLKQTALSMWILFAAHAFARLYGAWAHKPYQTRITLCPVGRWVPDLILVDSFILHVLDSGGDHVNPPSRFLPVGELCF